LNIYRLLRARSAMTPFPHQPTILLLGLVSGQPELAAYVLERLRKADSTMTIKQLANALNSDATGQMKAEWLTQLWNQSGDALRKLLDDLGPDKSVAELQAIGVEVQRYSFLKP